jgi:O-antigen/teichoic acid export membrane protein
VFGAAWAVLLSVPLLVLTLLGTVGQGLVGALLTRLDFMPFVLMALVTVYSNVAFIETAMALARTQELPGRYLSINLGRAVLTTGLVIGLLLVDDLDAEKVVAAQLAASLCVAAVCTVGMWRFSRPRADRGTASRLVRFSLPLMPLGASQWALRMQDRVILDKFVDLAAIGVYSMAYRLGSPLQILTQAALRTITPVMSQAGADPRRLPEARSGIGQYFGVSLPVALFGALSLPVVSPVLLPEAYAGAGEVGQWVLAGMLAMAVFQLAVNAGALYKGRFGLLTMLTVLGAAINVAMNVILIPRMGITGAAVAGASSYTLMAVIGFLVSPLPQLMRGLTKRLLITACLGVAAFAAVAPLRPEGVVLALTIVSIVSGAYAWCCHLLLTGVHNDGPRGQKGGRVVRASRA